MEKGGGHPDFVWTMQYFENFEMKERGKRKIKLKIEKLLYMTNLQKNLLKRKYLLKM
jgi:hypothetical protein